GQRLVDIYNSNQMCAFASVISDIDDPTWSELPLEIQTPFLCVGLLPIHCRTTEKRRGQIDVGRCSSRIVKGSAADADALHKRRIAELILLKIVRSGRIEEQAVTCANRSCTGGKWIPGNTNSGSKVEIGRPSDAIAEGRVLAADDHTIQSRASARNQI